MSNSTPQELGQLLHRAFEAGFLTEEIIRDYARKGADFNQRNGFGRTILMLCAAASPVHIVRALLDAHADVHLKDNNGETALHHAARQGYVSVIKALIGSGAVVDAENGVHETPLAKAVRENGPDRVGVLLDAGASLGPFGRRRDTALHVAAVWGRSAAARLLLKHGADVLAQNSSGDTPLDNARQFKRDDMVELLKAEALKAQIRKNRQTQERKEFEEWCDQGCPVPLSVLRDVPKIKLKKPGRKP